VRSNYAFTTLAPAPPPCPPSSIFTIEVPFYFLQKEKLLPNITSRRVKEEEEELKEVAAEVEAEEEAERMHRQLLQMIDR
jgi:hypothetical protein